MIAFDRLLSLVAARPAGEKVNIAAIRREFMPSQAEILAGINRLILAKRLDPLTLRPKHPPLPEMPAGFRRGQSRDGELSAELWAALDAERQRRGLTREAASLEIWGNKARIYRLRQNDTVRAETARRIRDWINSEARERPPGAAPAQPPEPRAAQEGGGESARGDPEEAIAEDSPPPSEIDPARLLECFGEDFEPLAAVAARYGCAPNRLVTISRRLRFERLIEWMPPTRGRMFALWRRAKKESPGASGKPREGPSAAESTAAKRIQDRAPIDPPAKGPHPKAEPPAVAPEAVESAAVARTPVPAPPALEERRRVDTKASERRDPTQPPPGYISGAEPSSPAKREFHAQAGAAKDRNRRGAEERLDAGKSPEDEPSVSMRITMRQIERERAESARQADPIEQAKTLIRRKTRFRVFGAEYADPPGLKGNFFIGNRLVDQAELLAYAARLGS